LDGVNFAKAGIAGSQTPPLRLPSPQKFLENLKIKVITDMSKICQITGKKSVVGNNVSHSLRRTKRRFNVNLFTKKFYYVEEDCWIFLKVSAAGLRIINRIGLDAAIRKALDKGYLDIKTLENQIIG